MLPLHQPIQLVRPPKTCRIRTLAKIRPRLTRRIESLAHGVPQPASRRASGHVEPSRTARSCNAAPTPRGRGTHRQRTRRCDVAKLFVVDPMTAFDLAVLLGRRGAMYRWRIPAAWTVSAKASGNSVPYYLRKERSGQDKCLSRMGLPQLRPEETASSLPHVFLPRRRPYTSRLILRSSPTRCCSNCRAGADASCASRIPRPTLTDS